MNKSTKAFFALVRAGLWEDLKVKESSFAFSDSVEWDDVYRLANEQSVLGLVIAGIDYLPNEQHPPKEQLLQWIGEIQMQEQQNQALNIFVRELVENMRKKGIYALLLGGQGVAQCYKRPMWRVSEGVDFLLSKDDYEEAKVYIAKIASPVESESVFANRISYIVGQRVVELHTSALDSLKKAIQNGMNDVWRSIFNYGDVRLWVNDGVVVYIPSPNNDVIIAFTRSLRNFCFGGIDLRQICDLCRLLWVYRDEIDIKLMKMRLQEMGLMTEWKVFASLMVNWLGMPKEIIPFYSDSVFYKLKANRACTRILRTGNLNVNADDSYCSSLSKCKASHITFWHRTSELFGLMTLFPLDAPIFLFNYLMYKVKMVRDRMMLKL